PSRDAPRRRAATRTPSRRTPPPSRGPSPPPRCDAALPSPEYKTGTDHVFARPVPIGLLLLLLRRYGVEDDGGFADVLRGVRLVGAELLHFAGFPGPFLRLAVGEGAQRLAALQHARDAIRPLDARADVAGL